MSHDTSKKWGLCLSTFCSEKRNAVNSEYNTHLLQLGKENEKKSGWAKGKFNIESEMPYFRGNSIASEASCMLHPFTQ